MPSAREVIKRLLPFGTNPLPDGTNALPENASWEVFPLWPPDMFAVAATLVTHAGLYCRPCFSGGDPPGFLTPECVVFARRVGARWARGPLADRDEQDLQALWRLLYGHATGDILDDGEPSPEWWDAALKLLLAADEAAEGVGFAMPSALEHVIAETVLTQHRLFLSGGDAYHANAARVMPYIPNSLCRMVPSSEACVQPKSRTPQLGLTLRSLTHHLALLPMRGEVSTSWVIGFSQAASPTKPLNLLLVPFPYRIAEDCFRDGGQVQEHVIRRVAHDLWETGGGGDGLDIDHWHAAEKVIEGKARYFDINQSWLRRPNGDEVTAAEFCAFLQQLMAQARRQKREIGGVILPEASLSLNLADQVAQLLATEQGLEFFIAGVAAPPTAASPFPKNQVVTYLYSTGGPFRYVQSKHHRWRLDKSQIEANVLEEQLDTKIDSWWEKINVEGRSCGLYVFRHGASLATLICEDLARIDPVQAAIRSVGPNLVVALLMDGPQWERRWPGRYATVLADDPGSSVLSLTSLGLMQRRALRAEVASRDVTLWKDASGKVHEIPLPSGQHALVLPLRFEDEENYSKDGRSDGKASVGIRLDRNGVRTIRFPGTLPDWVDQA